MGKSELKERKYLFIMRNGESAKDPASTNICVERL